MSTRCNEFPITTQLDFATVATGNRRWPPALAPAVMTQSTCTTIGDSSGSHSVTVRLLPLNLIIFLGFMTVSLPLAVLPLYASHTLESGPLMVGILIGLQSIATVITRPYAGRFADARGPRAATIVGLLICIAAGGLYMLSTLLPLGIAVLLLGRATLGLGESLILTGAITWGIGRVGEAHSGQVMSWNGIAMYAALAAGTPTGLGVYNLFSAPVVGFITLGAVSAALPLVALLCALPMPGTAAATRRSYPIGALLRCIWPLGLALTFLMASYGAIAAFYALYFEHQGWRHAGWGFAGFGCAVIGVRIAFGHLPDQIGGRRVAYASIATAALGQTLIWSAPVAAIAIAGATLTGAGVALGFPALGVEALARVNGAGKGMVIGLFSAFQDMAFGMTGPIAGLVMLSLGGGNETAFVIATATAGTAIVLLRLAPAAKNRPA